MKLAANTGIGKRDGGGSQKDKMMYKAYYGPASAKPIRALEKTQWPFKEFERLDDALLWARSLSVKGTGVLAIDGDDGTQLTRGEIAFLLLGERALPGTGDF
jgi:hypothetical protein